MAAAAAGAGAGLQLIGAAAATLLAAALVAAVLWRRRRGPRPHAALVEGKPAPEAGCGTSAAGDGGTDVIIVGAGVAGSALAYTLGKVAPLSSRSFRCMVPL
jgi:squalene monooxygenase